MVGARNKHKEQLPFSLQVFLRSAVKTMTWGEVRIYCCGFSGNKKLKAQRVEEYYVPVNCFDSAGRGRFSSPSSEAPSGALCPVLGSSVQER